MDDELIITAHPDDETLWFGGTVLTRPQRRWTVVCVTADRDATVAGRRRRELEAACAALGVAELIAWAIPDEPLARLPMEELARRVRALAFDRFTGVWTHGPSGEYGHLHHQDVGAAVHAEALRRGRAVLSPAYHTAAIEVQPLTAEVYRKKLEILTRTYAGEFYDFVQLLPSLPVEAFSRIENAAEAELAYAYFSGQTGLSEVRARAASTGVLPAAHIWLRESVSPPCSAQTYGLLSAADAALRRFGLSGSPTSAGAPEKLPTVSETAGLWAAFRRAFGSGSGSSDGR
jgi:LmbE family N-acetylglucosaminyl deacetylase